MTDWAVLLYGSPQIMATLEQSKFFSQEVVTLGRPIGVAIHHCIAQHWAVTGTLLNCSQQ